MILPHDSLISRAIIGSDGHEVGEVVRVFFDSDDLRVVSIQARVRNNVADRLGATHTIFRAGTVEIPVGLIRVTTDTVILTVSTETLQETLARSQVATTYDPR